MEKTFSIDFFELSFLAESCIPPTPIARSCFWDKLINVYYEQLSEYERKQLFKWIIGNPKFDLDNEDCAWFYHRYEQCNQYTVFTEKYGEYNSFFMNGKYYTAKNKYINPECIIEIKENF
jgi:hypothetical protein